MPRRWAHGVALSCAEVPALSTPDNHYAALSHTLSSRRKRLGQTFEFAASSATSH